MHRRSRIFRPDATPLESKLLLSLAASPLPDTADPAEVRILAAATPASTANAARGRYFAAEDNRAADAPLHVRLNGNGRVSGLGRARLTGSLDLGGFRVADSPDVTGMLTVANARGTVTLRLSGSGGFAEVPNGRLVTSASVVEGTGAYRNFRRIGAVTFQFGENQVRAIRAPSPIGGAMIVRFGLRPPVR